jgi:hypothetical protein
MEPGCCSQCYRKMFFAFIHLLEQLEFVFPIESFLSENLGHDPNPDESESQNLSKTKELTKT